MEKNQKDMNKKPIKNLAIIPARSGSKGIPGKNIKLFAGKPLIAHTIEQAKKAGIFDRIMVDTDSEKIAQIAKKFGAEAPFLRPAQLAGDKAQITDAIILLLERLKDKGYQPDIITLLQTTSPLREVEDIKRCAQTMENINISSVCTICETHHRLYHLSRSGRLILVNKPNHENQNRQAWPQCYILNGCMVYMVRLNHFLKNKKFVDAETRGIICDKWRSVDLDKKEDWVLAETLFLNKDKIKKKL